MNDANETGGTGPSHRVAEIGVAGVMALLALIGIYGSLQVGIGWGAEGPQAGFFPFYVSLIVLISCVVNVVSVLRVRRYRQAVRRMEPAAAGRFGAGADRDLCRAGALYRHLHGVGLADRILHALVRPL